MRESERGSANGLMCFVAGFTLLCVVFETGLKSCRQGISGSARRHSIPLSYTYSRCSINSKKCKSQRGIAQGGGRLGQKSRGGCISSSHKDESLTTTSTRTDTSTTCTYVHAYMHSKATRRVGGWMSPCERMGRSR